MNKHFSLIGSRSVADYISLLSIPLFISGVFLIFKGQPELALLVGVAAFLIDTIDGAVARRIGQESDFGRQLDSSLDVLNYLVFPVFFIMVFLSANIFVSIFSASIVIGFGILRLIRFNNQGFLKQDGSRYYAGLGVAYILLAVIVFYLLNYFLGNWVNWLVPPSLFFLSLAMISEFPLRKPKLAVWYSFTAGIVFILISIYFKWL